MLLRGNEFPNVWCAPGARGFFGEGYPLHPFFKMLGMTWKNTAFVSKTVTLEGRDGNMPLKGNGTTPQELVPRCIVPYHRTGHMLNAVGLSNYGAEWAFNRNAWQARTDPFMISFMTICEEKEHRLLELKAFCRLLKRKLWTFKTYESGKIALQLNFACPNTGHGLEERYAELGEMLDIVSELPIPIVVNFNPLVPVGVIMVAQEHEACDAIWIGNTIPWNSPGINWEPFSARGHLPGNIISPLIARGFKQPGGLSGPVCFPFTLDKICEARKAGFDKPIIGGNGVQRKADIDQLWHADADGVALGIVNTERPWRARGLIRYAHSLFD